MNILMPMAGAGKRFNGLCKPLVEIHGIPLFQRALECLGFKGDNHIFITQKEIYDKFDFDSLNLKNEVIALTEVLSGGAVCSVLQAKNLINSDTPLLVMVSDTLFVWDHIKFLELAASDVDGIAPIIDMNGPQYSYAKINPEGFVEQIAEKVQISNHGTTGAYFWKRGKDFVRCAESMMAKNIRTNNEFYIAPVFNEIIEEGGKIISYPIQEIYPIGTPSDLKAYNELGT
jgi:NDP-sugar pyrophosphorylase family protein